MRPVIIRADVNCDEGKKQRFRRLCQEKVDDAIFLVGYPGCHIIPIYETFLVSGAVRTRSGRPSLSGFVLPGQANARLITTTRTAHDLCLLPPETQNRSTPTPTRRRFLALLSYVSTLTAFTTKKLLTNDCVTATEPKRPGRARRPAVIAVAVHGRTTIRVDGQLEDRGDQACWCRAASGRRQRTHTCPARARVIQRPTPARPANSPVPFPCFYSACTTQSQTPRRIATGQPRKLDVAGGKGAQRRHDRHARTVASPHRRGNFFCVYIYI
jgi:hypothetical protein